MERQALDTRTYHRWPVGELAQIVELVGGCRRQLSDCVAGEVDVEVRDVDACLQQIEHLLSAIVRRHDVTGDDTQRDRLQASACLLYTSDAADE